MVVIGWPCRVKSVLLRHFCAAMRHPVAFCSPLERRGGFPEPEFFLSPHDCKRSVSFGTVIASPGFPRC